jgi:hypothetical protein
MSTLDRITAELATKVEEAVSLVVARRGPDDTADDTIQTAKVALAGNAAEGFRELCRAAIDRMATRQPVPYTADAQLDAGEVFILDDKASLEELADLRGLNQSAATLPLTAPRDLDPSIQFYAVVVGNSSRALFLRKTDPQIKYRSGRFLAVAGQQLSKLEEPAFTFAPGFDLVVADDWVMVLKQGPFESLFRDIGLVDQHIATWVTGITDHLPMEASSLSSLQEVAPSDSRTWRRLREIHRRGHLARVRLDDVRRYARGVGLDPGTLIQDGQLVFDPAERFSFLHLLNEDLYKGPLTAQTFEAQQKSHAEPQ